MDMTTRSDSSHPQMPLAVRLLPAIRRTIIITLFALWAFGVGLAMLTPIIRSSLLEVETDDPYEFWLLAFSDDNRVRHPYLFADLRQEIEQISVSLPDDTPVVVVYDPSDPINSSQRLQHLSYAWMWVYPREYEMINLAGTPFDDIPSPVILSGTVDLPGFVCTTRKEDLSLCR